MRVMVMVKATPNSEKGLPPKEKFEKALEAMGKFNDELAKAGVLLAMGGLQPSSKGKRVRFAGPKRTVIDGPFAEAKELVAGFWLWQVKSMEEAVEWVRRCPEPMPGEESDIEIRPLFEVEDLYGDELTAEQSARKARLEAAMERHQK
ncbi:MAG TPA: YciI family protein [Verrucomicrobiae bacterium]|nr:YciI family protein [Verrucomicrobiae bacterium]